MEGRKWDVKNDFVFPSRVGVASSSLSLRVESAREGATGFSGEERDGEGVFLGRSPSGLGRHSRGWYLDGTRVGNSYHRRKDKVPQRSLVPSVRTPGGSRRRVLTRFLDYGVPVCLGCVVVFGVCRCVWTRVSCVLGRLGCESVYVVGRVFPC